MLIQNSDGTCTGGRKDVICILNDLNTGKYHVSFFEESPFPGGQKDLSFVRLKSKMHHTYGSETIEGALNQLKEMREKIQVSDKNVWLEPQEWDGNQGMVWVVPNWNN